LNRIGIGIELNKKMFRDAGIKNIYNNFSDTFDGKQIKISESDFLGEN